MSENRTRYIVINKVDTSLDTISSQNNITTQDLEQFVKDSIHEVSSNKSNREFKLRDLSTQAVSLIIDSFNKDDNDTYNISSQKIAERLLGAEKRAQSKYGHMTNIQKGSLIQSFVKAEESHIFMAIKIEHTEFINENDFIKYMGLPFKRKVLKSCSIFFDKNLNVKSIMISDTHTPISEYWWSDFLELEKKHTDDHNTQTSFDKIEDYLKKEVKKVSPTDYTLIRNNVIGYFRTHPEFLLDDFVNNAIGSYEPDNIQMVNIEKVKKDLIALPTSHDFDSNFTIKKELIKARMNRKIYVNSNIEISIKGEISGLKDVIFSEEDSRGDKFIKIKTDNNNLFNEFNFKKRVENN